jgi:hypothetical protein
MSDTELYDDLRHEDIDSGIMEDTLSYRPGDSVADTIIAPSSLSNTGFIVRAQSVDLFFMVSNMSQEKFRFWSILGFTSTMMCTWELVLGYRSLFF